MPSTYQLKSRFQSLLRPIAAWLYQIGISANQVTVITCVISLALGAFACIHAEHSFWFSLIAGWCLLRMAANALDGMLAREFGQASRLGAVLNEICDVISDTALYLPFAFIAGSQVWLVMGIIVLAIISEFAGLLSAAMGGERSYQGPMGKSDRAMVFGIMALLTALNVAVAQFINGVWAVTTLLLLVTIFNRSRAAMTGKVNH